VAKKLRKKAVRNKSKKRYACTTCGLVVSVDTECGCLDTCDIVCCGEQMQPK